MRKLIAILLGAVMMLSLAIVGVSAADPEIITTAEQFAAIKADGNYKLGADIAVASTLVFKDAEDKEVGFTGTLDGDGHTITVSAPIFSRLSGTVKNLVIKGSVSGDGKDQHVAPLALRSGSGATVVLDNIINYATVNTGYRGAGIFSQIDDKSTATITNCENHGAVTFKYVTYIDNGEEKKTSSMVAGIIAYQQGATLVLKDCVNEGAISTNNGLAGGILGRFGGDYTLAKTYSCTIDNCLNKGTITGGSTVGGIAGFARSCTMTIKNCTNDGEVKSDANDAAGILSASNVAKGTTQDGTKNVSNCGNSDIIITGCVNNGNISSTKGRGAGICGYVWAGGGADSVVNHVDIENNLNKGTISGTTHVSQIMAYTNSKDNIVKNNVGLGKVSKGADAAFLSFYSFSSAAIPAELKDNIIVDDGSEYATYTGTAANSGSITKIDAEGAAAMVAVKSEADAKAAADALGTIGVQGTVGYKAPAAPGDPSQPTGDTAVWVLVIAGVSLLGMGIALKARRA